MSELHIQIKCIPWMIQQLTRSNSRRCHRWLPCCTWALPVRHPSQCLMFVLQLAIHAACALHLPHMVFRLQHCTTAADRVKGQAMMCGFPHGSDTRAQYTSVPFLPCLLPCSCTLMHGSTEHWTTQPARQGLLGENGATCVYHDFQGSRSLGHLVLQVAVANRPWCAKGPVLLAAVRWILPELNSIGCCGFCGKISCVGNLVSGNEFVCILSVVQLL